MGWQGRSGASRGEDADEYGFGLVFYLSISSPDPYARLHARVPNKAIAAGI